MSRSWQVEMGWHCSFCKGLNRGRHKECQGCGAPLDHSNFIDLPDEGEGREFAVHDPELVKQAKAGRDWKCRYCRSQQRRDNGDCANCGSDQSDSKVVRSKFDNPAVSPVVNAADIAALLRRAKKAKKQDQEAELQRYLREAVSEDDLEEIFGKGETQPEEEVLSQLSESDRDLLIEAVAGMGYRGIRRRKKDPNLPEEKPEDSTPPTTIEPPDSIPTGPRPWNRIWWGRKQKIAGGVMLGATLLGLLAFILFRTRIVDGEVTALAWTHTVAVERYQIKRDQGFNASKPGDAFDVHPLGMRHHHYDQVADGTKQVPYQERYACGTTPRVCSPSCTTNGNGFKTCTDRCTGGNTKYCNRTKYRTETKYKDVSREEMWYHWKVWRWLHNRNIVARGTADEPYWPSEEEIGLNKNLGTEAKDEREKRKTTYKVTFTDPADDTHGYTPSGLGEFMRLRMGSKRKIRVGILRSTQIMPE